MPNRSVLARIQKNARQRLGLLSCLCSLGLLLAMCVSGCRETTGPRRVAVAGSIITSEKLLLAGTIRFLPEPGNNGPNVMTSIQGGLYGFSKVDGPYPGKYKVVVNLELDEAQLAKISAASESPPPMMWEESVMVPDTEKSTKHFLWPKSDKSPSTSKQKSSGL